MISQIHEYVDGRWQGASSVFQWQGGTASYIIGRPLKDSQMGFLTRQGEPVLLVSINGGGYPRWGVRHQSHDLGDQAAIAHFDLVDPTRYPTFEPYDVLEINQGHGWEQYYVIKRQSDFDLSVALIHGGPWQQGERSSVGFRLVNQRGELKL